jgi:2,3-bisphosphoglycerate-dependent phosphoglycerate mutase
MAKIILLRHGQSQWNKQNVFTGWVDVPLSQQGIEESIAAGKNMAHLSIDIVYTSTLVRAQTTAVLALAQSKQEKIPYFVHAPSEPFSDWYEKGIEKTGMIPIYSAWELNERMYGALQGKNKDLMRKEFGSDQIHKWRRSFLLAPPEGEALADTAKRAIPFFENRLLPYLAAGKNLLVCAHGNSLRSIVMHIEKLSQEQVLDLEIATGELYIYEYQEGGFFRS